MILIYLFLVDESHRTQNGQLHAKMRKVFPSGCYIGFTGTPPMKKEKNSFTQFGKEIHRYTINQAVDDKAVLPLLYEGRLVDQWISDEAGLERKFEMISRNLNDEQKEDLKTKVGKIPKGCIIREKIRNDCFRYKRALQKYLARHRI